MRDVKVVLRGNTKGYSLFVANVVSKLFVARLAGDEMPILALSEVLRRQLDTRSKTTLKNVTILNSHI